MHIDELLLTVHILAVAIWIGAAMALQVSAVRMGPSTPAAVVDRFAIDADAVAKMLFAPALVVVLMTGVALVAHEHIRWTSAWILFGFGSLVVIGAIGGAFLIPEARRIAELARQPGHDPAEVRTRTRRRLLVARIDLSMLILAVADMVFRPGQ
jgi:uncharacterized membrane protein